MLIKIKNYNFAAAIGAQRIIGPAFLFLFSVAAAAAGQQPAAPENAAQKLLDAVIEKPAPTIKPVLSDLLKIKIGTTADEVRKTLGKAEIDDEDGFYYEISDDEIAQIRIDKDKKVRLIAVTYSSKHKNAPKYADVFGAETDEAAVAKPDGSIYHLVRYPESGYWVAYSRTAGENPEVTVTMQKL